MPETKHGDRVSADAAQQPKQVSIDGSQRMATWHRNLLTQIEQWRWLHTLNEGLSGVLQPWHDRHQAHPVVELLHGGRWTGHALHPALSDLPIGLWVGSVLLDTYGRDTGQRENLDPAGTLSAAGLVAAVATAATGVNDWTVSDGSDRRLGLFHGVLNAAGMVLQGASLGSRLSGHRRPARALGTASLAVTVAAAYVGGHLVQGRAVMVNRTAWFTGPQRWVRALREADLPDQVPTGVDVEGRRVLLHRHGDTLYALDNTCSHAGGLLSRGEVADETVTCPLHGSRFNLRDGRVLRGPAHHPQPVLPVRVRNGWIEVRGSPPRSRRTQG